MREAGRWPWRVEPRRGLLTSEGVVLAAGIVLAAAALIESVLTSLGDDKGPSFVLGVVVLSLCATLPVALPGRATAGVAVTVANLFSLGLFGILTVAGSLAQLLVAYRFGRDSSGGRPSNLWAGALAVPFVVAALVGQRPAANLAAFLTVLLAVLVPVAAGAGVLQEARGEATLHRAASEAIAGTLIEHTARGERARIARELHDVVAHHVSMIAVQAETARLTTPGMPQLGQERLSAIGDTARMALTEMRGLLGVLREDAAARLPDLRPQPGLQQLNELLDATRAASSAGARLIVSGPATKLDPVVELAAYRIAQEALTNARRHAPGAAVDVELRFSSGAVRLRIRDNGPGPQQEAPNGGHGLAGMRERVVAVGGEMRVGAAPGGGFVVEVTLPTTAQQP